MVFLTVKIEFKYPTDMPPKLQWGNCLCSFSCCWWGRIQNLKSFGFFRMCCLWLGVHILYKFIFFTQKIQIKTKLKQEIHRQHLESLTTHPESIQNVLAFNLRRKRKTLLLYISVQNLLLLHWKRKEQASVRLAS